MNWLGIVLAGHLLTAVSYILSKFLLTKSFQNPFIFTFYVGFLGLASLFLIPLGFEVPTAIQLFINLLSGALFTLALLFFFISLQGAETSRIVPFIGAGIPVFTLIFELIFLEGNFTFIQLTAFAVLVLGSVVITYEKGGTGFFEKTQLKLLGGALIAALCFALALGISKVAFIDQPFMSAFIWMRLGSFLSTLVILFSTKHRVAVIKAVELFKKKEGIIYLVTQSFGAVGFLLVSYAISLASVSIINALQGVQYAFLLIIAIIATVKYPNLLKENIGKSSLLTKISGVVIIIIGILMISLNMST
ncbi:MAG: hypothetical protein Q8P90_03040 [bacterium]|nr:hypothetical protein [bacterium]